MKTLKNSDGFSVVHTILIMVILGIVGFTGWYVWKVNNSSTDATSNAAKTSQDSRGTKDIQRKEYRNDEYGFMFEYPSDWKLDDMQKDIGRGALEGNITVTSPKGTVVTFDANQGGKGGDCADEEANDQWTARSCYTIETLRVESFDAGVGNEALYFYESKVTPPTRKGDPSYYRVGLKDSSYVVPVKGSRLDSVDVDLLVVKGGSLEVRVSGKDDSENNSSKFFRSNEVKEAYQILKTVRLTK